MRIEISHRPSYAIATVLLDAGESVVGEAGAMVSMDSHVTIQTISTPSRRPPERRGCLGSLNPFRGLFGGNRQYQNMFVSPGRPGAVTFAPGIPGDIETYEVTEERGLIMQSSSLLCHSDTIGVDTAWTGSRQFMKAEGVFMVRASGEGWIGFSTFGGLKELQVEDHFLVDSGHLVAFEDNLEYEIRQFSRGIWKSLFGGEARVCEFTGRGRVWIQSRNVGAYGKVLGPKLPKRWSKV